MRTPICDRLGIDVPIFGFSHCRDVVSAISKAGGMGVLGTSRFTPQQLALELQWLDENSGGRPYGLDVMMPTAYQGHRIHQDQDELRAQIPTEYWEFVDRVLEDLGVPPLNEGTSIIEWMPRHGADDARDSLDVAASAKGVRLVASALGTPSADAVAELHRRDILVGALAGRVKHARKHVEAGVDFVVAQGTEAAGHTGDISTMVLTPDVVDSVAPVPVLAAGGIASGRQVAAAMALGAEGAWLGSAWLTTAESEVHPEVKKRLVEATADDTVRARHNTGKPGRSLRDAWSDAWAASEAPPPLPMPLQALLIAEAKARIERAGRYDLVRATVGQVVGRLNSFTTVQDVMTSLVTEYIETVERLNAINALASL